MYVFHPGTPHTLVCLRTGQGTVVERGLLDSGVFVGDHHACILQGPYSPAMITGNTYRFGILEYKSKHVKMYFIKSISEVSKCLDDYCRNELAALRSRSPELVRRTILFTVDSRSIQLTN